MGYWDKKENNGAKQDQIEEQLDFIEEEEFEDDEIESDAFKSPEEVEETCKETVDQWKTSFRERMKKENARKKAVTDSGYYVCVYFSNREQCDEFLEKFGLSKKEIFVDGRKIARMCNKALETPDTDFPRTQGIDKDYLKRVRH